MTLLYRPVKIVSAEQAEALPIGTVALDLDHDDTLSEVATKREGGAWYGTYGVYVSHSIVGDYALVPIEAEEETTRSISPEVGAFGSDDEIPEHYLGPPRTRYLTAWQEADQ